MTATGPTPIAAFGALEMPRPISGRVIDARARAWRADARIRLTGIAVDCQYGLDEGQEFQQLGEPADVHVSWWNGARPASLAFHTEGASAPAGYVDVDRARYAATSEDAPAR